MLDLLADLNKFPDQKAHHRLDHVRRAVYKWSDLDRLVVAQREEAYYNQNEWTDSKAGPSYESLAAISAQAHANASVLPYKVAAVLHAIAGHPRLITFGDAGTNILESPLPSGSATSWPQSAETSLLVTSSAALYACNAFQRATGNTRRALLATDVKKAELQGYFAAEERAGSAYQEATNRQHLIEAGIVEPSYAPFDKLIRPSGWSDEYCALLETWALTPRPARSFVYDTP